MAVHTILIDSTADENRIELRSAARWALGPGCTLRFSAHGATTDHVQLEIDDRVVRFARERPGGERMMLEVPVATTEDRLTLLTEKTGRGSLVVSGEMDSGRNDADGDGVVAATVVLFLRSADCSTASPDRGLSS